MRAFGLVGPLIFAATSLAQAVPEGIAPPSSPPDGCQTTVSGSFELGTLDNPSLRHKRAITQASVDNAVTCTLNNGILHDQLNRTGSIVANQQFQFDGPPQAGALYTGGFSVCQNGSLALGGTTRWWRCMSGNFGNLYDQWIGSQCYEIRIQAIFPNQASSSVTEPVSMVAKSDFPTSTLAPTPTTSALLASQTDSTTRSAGAAASLARPTPSVWSSSPSSIVAIAPPAKLGNAASSYKAKGAALFVVAILGAALNL